jgi:chromosome segregation ATPase
MSAAVCLVHSALALAQADQLKLEALVQEGDLILEEAATLAPAAEQLAQEGQQLAASEHSLREEVRSLNQTIVQFNATMAEQSQSVHALQTQCADQTTDKALADDCNTRLAQLREQGNTLEEQRGPVRARQEELNARVDKHNAWGRDYAKRKHAQDSTDALNQRDAEEWLERAKQFLASKDFALLLAQAGNPAACRDEQMSEIATLSVRTAFDRAQDCLKAVKGTGR